MKIVTVTNKRKAGTTIADSQAYLYAWGALSVTYAMISTDYSHEVHVTLDKAELVSALSKITQREDEIENLTNRGN